MDEEKEFRVVRWLCNVAYICGVPHGPGRIRIGLEGAMILLNPTHPEHEKLFSMIEWHLPATCRTDLQTLRSLPKTKQILETEATLNRLRAVSETK